MAQLKTSFKNSANRMSFDLAILVKQQAELQRIARNQGALYIPNSREEPRRLHSSVSLGCLSASHPIRRVTLRIIDHSCFEKFILIAIIANGVTLPVDGYLPEKYQGILEIAFLMIFTAEMILKVIALGFIMTEYTYLRDPWNSIDFLVVLFG